MNAQTVLSQNLARLSPSASYLFAVMRVAGTRPALWRYFHKAYERFREEFRESMNKI